MIIEILMALAAIVAVLIVIVAAQPSDFRITRSGIMRTPAAAVFEQVNDLRKWHEWSPWAKIDPNVKNTYEGPASGTGAVMSWTSDNKQVGEGRMTIIESHPVSLIRINLEFFKPFKGTNTSEFSFKQEGDEMVVTWTMRGKNNFFGKAFGMIMNCNKMIGGQFEKGLANLKAIVESNTTPTSKPIYETSR
jgi:hypothetical protein